ncbi:MAG: hypothetical protein QOG54_756 [Actinomycetota bacterium]|nr:hypothetical protein [Actinomycetota bacterium]
MSQEDLAAGRYSAAYISHLEKGRRSPSGEVLDHIAERLEVPSEQLLTGKDPDIDLRIQLEIDRAIARIHSGEADVVTDELELLSKRAKRENLNRSHAAALEGLGLIAKQAGLWTKARDLFVQAEELLKEEPPEARTSLVTGRAWTHFMSGEINLAIHILERHLVDLDEGGAPDPTALLQTYSYLIGPYFEAGFRDKAALMADRAHDLETRVQDPEHVACMNINRAQILLEENHRDEAMRCLARAEDLFKQIGWRDSATKAAISQATAAVETGNLDEGERQARAVLAEVMTSPSTVDTVTTLNLLARIERLRERPDAAIQHLDEVIRILGKETSLDNAWAFREKGLCYMELGDPKRAERMLRKALAMHREAKSPNQAATTAAYLGDALRAMGRPDEAFRVYREALADLENLAI